MEDLVIDANIIEYLYREEVQLYPVDPINQSGSAIALFRKIEGDNDIIYIDGCMDSESQILNEWLERIPKEDRGWFTNWLSLHLLTGRIQYIVVDCHDSYNILQELLRNGFPLHSRDKWYVRTAHSVTQMKSTTTCPILATIISEDLDFFDPTQKRKLSGINRVKTLQSADGVLPDIFANYKIGLCCISGFLELSEN